MKPAIKPRFSDFVTAAGVPMRLAIVYPGEYYGLDDTLLAEVPLAEFYDRRYPFTKNGQFIARYNVESIHYAVGGLLLNGSVGYWSVDSRAMNLAVLPVLEQVMEVTS